MIVTTGKGLTVKVTSEVLEHPFISVPVIQYVVVMPGLAAIVVPVSDDNPVGGFQIYVAAPRAVSIIELPKQTTGAEGSIVITGNGLTVIKAEEVLVQPFRSVPVTIYVEVATGFTVTVIPVSDDRP